MHKRYHKGAGYSYTLGASPTVELITTRPELAECVYISDKYTGNTDVSSLCTQHGIPVVYSAKAVERLALKENTYVAGIFRIEPQPIRVGDNHIVLDGVGDMGNLGTILRTAAGYGVEDVAIITPAADAYHPKTVRASMGALFHLRVNEYGSYAEYAAQHANTPYPFMLGGRHELHRLTSMHQPFALIFGNEASGLDQMYASFPHTVRITHRQTIDSLNLPIAVGIALYHVTNIL